MKNTLANYPFKSLVLASGFLMVSGCAMVGPDFQKPDPKVAETWSNTDKAEIVGEDLDNREWWKNFNDPILNKLIQTAYQQSLGLQIAGLRVYEARAILGVATGSLYPQSQRVGASSSRIKWSENAEPIANLPPAVGSLVDSSFNHHRVGLDAAWELDLWGRFRRGVESADANLAASIATYDDVLVTLTGEVATAYILLRTLEERLSYANKNVAVQQRSYDIADVRNRNGLVTELDVQLARTLLANTQARIPVLKTAIRKTKLALSLLLGMQPGELNKILGSSSGVIPVSPKNVAVGIPADLLRRRPDIRKSELQAAAQSARIGIAQTELYPSFRLIGTVGYAAESGGDLLEGDSATGFGTVGFSWKILNYGRLRNNVRVQDARFQQLLTAYENTVLNASREVEEALESFVQARQRVNYLSSSVKAARRAVELAQTQYRDGIISYTLVLDAQQFMLLNEDQLTEARGNVATSVVAAYKALGGGWQIREGNDFIPDSVKSTMEQRSNWGDLLEPAAVEPVSETDRGKWRAPDK